MSDTNQRYDVVVVGGGAAGLSGRWPCPQLPGRPAPGGGGPAALHRAVRGCRTVSASWPTDLETVGQVIGSYIAADPTGATEVPGVWAEGNVAHLVTPPPRERGGFSLNPGGFYDGQALTAAEARVQRTTPLRGSENQDALLAWPEGRDSHARSGMEQVVGAANAGLRAGAVINADLVTDNTRRAVEARRAAPFSAGAERKVTERVLGNRRHGLQETR